MASKTMRDRTGRVPDRPRPRWVTVESIPISAMSSTPLSDFPIPALVRFVVAMNTIRYILKFAFGVALAYAVGNVLHTSKMTYILYGASLNIHPIAGDTVGFVRGKVQASALGAAYGMVLELAFQGNQVVALAIGPPLLMAGGYWFRVPKRILMFSAIVVVAAAGNATFTAEPFEFIGLRYWNMFIGSAVGMAVNIFFWPDTDTDKLNPAFATSIASIRSLYDRTIDDYLQGRLADHVAARQQLRADIEGQLSAIDTLMGTAQSRTVVLFHRRCPLPALDYPAASGRGSICVGGGFGPGDGGGRWRSPLSGGATRTGSSD